MKTTAHYLVHLTAFLLKQRRLKISQAKPLLQHDVQENAGPNEIGNQNDDLAAEIYGDLGGEG